MNLCVYVRLMKPNKTDWTTEKCAGVLVWQMNDCWPVVSWAIADYFVRAFYATCRLTLQDGF